MTEVAATLVPKSAASRGSIASTQRSEMPALKLASAMKTIASRGEAALGGKPLHRPARAGARIEQPVVQAVGAALPELDLSGNDAIAAPVRRPRRRVAVAPARLLH